MFLFSLLLGVNNLLKCIACGIIVGAIVLLLILSGDGDIKGVLTNSV
jgi:hypothetical protein